ncbi:MAG: hypothetical protein U0796_04840 [Gemmatales bacterium]
MQPQPAAPAGVPDILQPALKGRDRIAQGNALGHATNRIPSPKGAR